MCLNVRLAFYNDRQRIISAIAVTFHLSNWSSGLTSWLKPLGGDMGRDLRCFLLAWPNRLWISPRTRPLDRKVDQLTDPKSPEQMVPNIALCFMFSAFLRFAGFPLHYLPGRVFSLRRRSTKYSFLLSPEIFST